MSWKTFLETAPAADHAVQIYERFDDLVGSVGRFFDAGFEAGEPAIVIATDEHSRAFRRDLEARGWDPAELQRKGLLTFRDADATLAAFLEGAVPSADRFERVVGAAIDEITRRHPGKTIRAFGEMVDLLWARGEPDAAIALEELWNGLAETRKFALLCGYQLDIFDMGVQQGALPRIFGAHTHPRPAADVPRLGAALDRALAETVGPVRTGQIYLQVAEQVPRSSLPRAAAVLMWLSEQSTPTAAEILDRVRMHYRWSGPSAGSLREVAASTAG
jgi:hypothetical protein